jgi:hypothetical protein
VSQSAAKKRTVWAALYTSSMGFSDCFDCIVPMGISASVDERGYEYTGLDLGVLPTPEFLKSATSQMEVRT